MGWIESEPLRFFCPAFADELEGSEAFEGLEPPSKVVGIDEVAEMSPELVVVVVVILNRSGFAGGSRP